MHKGTPEQVLNAFVGALGPIGSELRAELKKQPLFHDQPHGPSSDDPVSRSNVRLREVGRSPAVDLQGRPELIHKVHLDTRSLA